MFDSILVPLDGSEFSEQALPMAQALASKLGARVHLVHVILPARDSDLKSPQEDMEWKQRVREGAEEYLRDRAAELAEEGLEVRTDILEGTVVDSLAEYVDGAGVSLVVMTTHGTGGLRRWWLGSVADGLLRRGPSNVLLVRPWDDTEDQPEAVARFGHLAVPLDGSDEGELALEPARRLARAFDAETTLIRIIPAPMELTSIYGVAGVRLEGEGHRDRRAEAEEYLQGVVDRMPSRGDEPSVRTEVAEHGRPAEGIIDAARKLDVDLLVLSSHGRGGLARMVLGSVADKVIRGTTRPVLVIRPPADD